MMEKPDQNESVNDDDEGLDKFVYVALYKDEDT